MDDELFLRMEQESRSSQKRVRQLIREAGRPDVLADYEANMHDIRTGVMQARNIWHSISEAQRRVLIILAEGRTLRRASKTRYDAYGEPHALANVCGVPTMRALCLRELLICDGPLLDPERKVVITEHGRFIVAHGQPK